MSKGKLEDERVSLDASRRELTKLLEEDDVVYDSMKMEFKDLMKRFGTKRKTQIRLEDDGDLGEIDLIKNSRSVIVVNRGRILQTNAFGQF